MSPDKCVKSAQKKLPTSFRDHLCGSTRCMHACLGVLWVCTLSCENYRPAKPVHSDRVMDIVAMNACKKRLFQCISYRKPL